MSASSVLAGLQYYTVHMYIYVYRQPGEGRCTYTCIQSVDVAAESNDDVAEVVEEYLASSSEV